MEDIHKYHHSPPIHIGLLKRILFDDKEKCWPWIGQKLNAGYGILKKQKARYLAHRVSWEYFNQKKIPDGLCVLHKCDNPQCVNPGHLFVGTHQDNVDDCISKGRQVVAVGESLPQHKLHRDEVIEIRSLFKTGVSQKHLCEMYEMSATQIHQICRHKAWKHVSESEIGTFV